MFLLSPMDSSRYSDQKNEITNTSSGNDVSWKIGLAQP